MKSLAIVVATVMLAVSGSVSAGEIEMRSSRTVYVWVNMGNTSNWPVVEAKAMAGKMLASAGVNIEWRTGLKPCEHCPETIVITFKDGATCLCKKGVLARAKVFEGTHIEVFYDRIQAVGAKPLLAHVLVHEITHILQGINRHAPSGIMKAVWSGQDFSSMARNPLPFTEEDVNLIHAGLEVRAAAEGSSLSASAFRHRVRQ
jgi:hypothetical protein